MYDCYWFFYFMKYQIQHRFTFAFTARKGENFSSINDQRIVTEWEKYQVKVLFGNVWNKGTLITILKLLLILFCECSYTSWSMHFDWLILSASHVLKIKNKNFTQHDLNKIKKYNLITRYFLYVEYILYFLI